MAGNEFHVAGCQELQVRYFTLEQREFLRDALTHRAVLLRGEISDYQPDSRRIGRGSLALRNKQQDQRELDALDGAETEAEVEQVMRQLRGVTETLAKLRSPDYGICVDCEGDIPFVRLQSDPALTRCPRCQQRHDLAQFVPNEL
jgi:RNA polymerase-binding transcription factor DksA